MKLPSFKRWLKTDFEPEQQELVEQMGESLNTGIELLYQALNKRLTITDNLQATEKDVLVSVFPNGNPRAETFVNTDFGSPVRTVFIGKVENLTVSGVYPTGAPFVSWITTPSGIQIVNISGLIPTNTYRLRLVIFG